VIDPATLWVEVALTICLVAGVDIGVAFLMRVTREAPGRDDD